MKRTALLFAGIMLLLPLMAQQNHKSIHQEEQEYYNSLGISEAEYQQINQPAAVNNPKSAKACNLNKVVFGWHPYWSAGLEANYDWELMSDMSFFSYEVNSTTGNANSTHGWATSNAVTQALANGVRVNLCVTLFSDHGTFLNSSTSRQTLITNLINLVQSRGAHGVNIDFEGVSSTYKAQFTNFLIDLCTQMHASVPGSKVSVCVYAVDWSDLFDEAAIDPFIDYYTIMGYDYYYSGSSIAGPTAPLYTFNTFNYNLAKTINYYMSQGASKEKIILGLPYYGHEWNTTSSTVPSSTTSVVSSRTYKTIRDNTSGNYSTRQFESTSKCPYYVYYSSNWRQAFCDDEESLAWKYDLVNMTGIGGIGIWALGYDDGYSELWDLIREKFTDCGTVPCSGTFYDLGGPDKVYFNNSNYNFTIAPTNATRVTLEFPVFDIEAGSGATCNYDYVEIFDGPDMLSPSLGRFCNTTGAPGLITSTGNALTVKVYTDNATVNNGFTGVWNCVQDDILPTTNISAGTWQKDDFIATFTDADNDIVDLRFYQVLDNDGTEWRANGDYGFFNDNFGSTIHSDWTNLSGTWSVTDAHLRQSDEALSNNNIYADVTQSDDGVYLYHWQMKLSGAGTNRRAGLYIFCSDPSLDQRGDAYMIYFRADQNKCQLYRADNNVITIYTDDDVTVNEDTWYDYKVMYNPANGELKAFQNDVLVSSWTDPSPITAGTAVSLRTGGCIADYDDIKVYKSRSVTETVSVGAGQEVRYENANSSSPACRIKSIVTDASGNISTVAGFDVNIDFTAPLASTSVNDGPGGDIDVTYVGTQLQANWAAAVEPNSYVTNYEYCIGTSAGASNTVAWTSNGTNTSVTRSGLTLISGTTYYFSVRSTNVVNLTSTVSSSDGIMYVDPASLTIADFTTSSTNVCAGEAISFINLSQNADTYQWTITGPQNESSTDESPSFVLTAGTYSVSLTAYGSLGDDNITQSITVVVNPLPVAASSVSSTDFDVCPGAGATLSYSGGSGTSFKWFASSCGGTLIGSGNNLLVNPVSATTYYGRWENSCGYSACQNLTINVNPLPVEANSVSATENVICFNESLDLSYDGGSGDSFNWYTADCGNTFVGIGNNLNVSPTTNTVYYGRWENACGNSACKTVSVTVNPLQGEPTNISADLYTICEGEQAVLSFTGGSGSSFKWFEESCGETFVGEGNDLAVGPIADKTYYGRWENGCGFSNCLPVTISVNPLPDEAISVSADYPNICNGEVPVLSYAGGSGDVFNWYTDACGSVLVGSGNDFSVNPGVNTTYFGRWENACGNSVCGEVAILYGQNPEAIFSALATTIQLPNAFAYFTNASQNADTWFWEFGDGADATEFEPYHQYTAVGVYTVTLTASNAVCGSDVLVLNDYIIVIDPTEANIVSTDELKVYPVPANNFVNVCSKNEIVSVSLLTVDGKLCRSYDGKGCELTIDLSDLSESEYILLIETAFEKIVKRVVVMRD
ncbi:MAG: glycosyl hydrolase family 18 protein [Bacteroidales bacterium]|nr:glycosyl hydrolase family 18 protein [Bacteroidales bacterium]